ncbi:MAG: hypothetical protein WC758_07585 [Candidatus Woesearchaeota archaeon]|jgi:hypothetical protein
MNNLNKITKELKQELDSLTVKELASNKDKVVEQLQTIVLTIQDYLSIIKIKKGGMVLPD